MSQADAEAINRDIALMDQVQALLGSDLGKYLTNRANDERDDALSKLASHDPEDSKGIRDLQNQIYRAESVLLWLDEATQAGMVALQQLDVLNAPD